MSQIYSPDATGLDNFNAVFLGWRID